MIAKLIFHTQWTITIWAKITVLESWSLQVRILHLPPNIKVIDIGNAMRMQICKCAVESRDFTFIASIGSMNSYFRFIANMSFDLYAAVAVRTRGCDLKQRSSQNSTFSSSSWRNSVNFSRELLLRRRLAKKILFQKIWYTLPDYGIKNLLVLLF